MSMINVDVKFNEIDYDKVEDYLKSNFNRSQILNMMPSCVSFDITEDDADYEDEETSLYEVCLVRGECCGWYVELKLVDTVGKLDMDDWPEQLKMGGELYEEFYTPDRAVMAFLTWHSMHCFRDEYSEFSGCSINKVRETPSLKFKVFEPDFED